MAMDMEWLTGSDVGKSFLGSVRLLQEGSSRSDVRRSLTAGLLDMAMRDAMIATTVRLGVGSVIAGRVAAASTASQPGDGFATLELRSSITGELMTPEDLSPSDRRFTWLLSAGASVDEAMISAHAHSIVAEGPEEAVLALELLAHVTAAAWDGGPIQ